MGHKNGVGGLDRNFGVGDVGPLNFDVGNRIKRRVWRGCEVCYYKGIIKNFAKFTGKHLCWSILLNKVPG